MHSLLKLCISFFICTFKCCEYSGSDVRLEYKWLHGRCFFCFLSVTLCFLKCLHKIPVIKKLLLIHEEMQPVTLNLYFLYNHKQTCNITTVNMCAQLCQILLPHRTCLLIRNQSGRRRLKLDSCSAKHHQQ